MGFLADEIEKTAFELGIAISKLQIDDAIEIRKKLAIKFSKEPDFPWRLSYQNLKNFQSIHDSKAWTYIQDYTREMQIILFVNSDEEKEMWVIPSGKALTLILSETTGFPFYVTSKNTDYLVCFDDHDCLIATGEAAQWISQLKVIIKAAE